MSITPAMIGHASDALGRLLEFTQPADAVLSAYFREHRVLGGRERGFVAETCYAVLRRKRQLEKLVSPAKSPRWLVLAALLRFGGVGQKQLADVVSAAEKDWLLEFKSRPEPEFSLADQADLPDWLVEKLLMRLSSAELLELARALNQGAPLDLRVNSIKATREEVLTRLAAENIAAEPCRYAPLGIRLKAKPALQKHPLYLEGAIEVQDEGSQLLGYLLAPKRGEMVVDFCAGAGGKTLLLGALMRSTGRLYAFDVSDKRLAKLKPRVARSGLSNMHPICIASENDIRVKRLAGKIDRVLVDAPCSGLGTLRRNPDLKWRQTPQSVEELSRKQRDILTGAARLVKPGGRLVYATCSILGEENETVVDAFLAAHADFHRLSAAEVLAQQGIVIDCSDACNDMRLLPHRHGTDGFYAAVLERALC
ncbi:MAG: RsmB/NOP family class I SAM-dependent RNA methyltransferase [Betaproteobacteria bacterium]|nr:RsmB/NOP family class I SAM-dependent RNA methyltransferase [Betaproteobacteria bacterium]